MIEVLAEAEQAGNSKAKRWCFTENNPTCELVFDPLMLGYLVYQKEFGANKTPHFQGYVEFKERCNLRGCKKWNRRAHFKVARGSAAQNKVYCTKEEGRLDGPWELGEPSSQGRRADLEKVAQLAREEGYSAVLDQHPGMCIRYERGLKNYLGDLAVRERETEGFKVPKIRIYLGDTGSGKTKKCYTKYPDLYDVSTHTGGTLWMDGYRGQKTVLFDDFNGGIPFRLLLRIMDGYPLRLPFKGGFTVLQHDVLLFTTNLHPDHWYSNAVITRNLDISPLQRRISEFGKLIKM